jgi:hypothetical protein
MARSPLDTIINPHFDHPGKRKAPALASVFYSTAYMIKHTGMAVN